MPLVNCPECGRQVSTAAEACPQCGFPMKAAATNTPAVPKCYGCAAAATTRCQNCGTPSCVEHLDRVNYGFGPRVLCKSCRTSHKDYAIVVSVLIILIFGGLGIAWLLFGSR
jgi:hypothetical protein